LTIVSGVPRWNPIAAALGAALLASCGAAGESTRDATSGAVVVFAASSLTEPFIEIGDAFEAAHPGTTVTFNVAGSGDLVNQVVQGAPADVVVTADEWNMSRLIDEGLHVGEPVVIARNTFEIIVEPGNPMGVMSLADLARPDLVVVLCADTVPCGRGAAAVLANAGVAVTPKSYEEKVKGVVTKVTTGEADAGLVFSTDVRAAGASASGVAIPADVNVITAYPLVVTRDAPNAVAARQFAEYVVGPEGRAVLASHGFLTP
jgi:molybdate transport system substrate-binding protein